MHVIKDDLVLALWRYDKTLNDIVYVSYKLYNEVKATFEDYYCTIDEFLAATTLATCPLNLTLMCYVCYVGENWWFDYDYQGVLNIHIQPSKPLQHKPPSKEDIVSIET